MFPSEKARLFPIFERRKIVQKHRKTSYFLAVIVDIAFPMKSPLLKTLNCPAGKLRSFLSYSWPFKLHSHSNFAASVPMNK